MIYVTLFWCFLQIGFTSFGGLSMVPLINSEMVRHAWMTSAEVADIIAIAEMTPGPLGLNCATFAGYQAAGVLGAVCANLGVLFPSFSTGFLVAVFFERFQKMSFMQNMLTGIRPACMGLIGGVIVTMCRSNYLVNGAVSLAAIGIALAAALCLLVWKRSIPEVIGICALLGLVLVR